MYDMVSMAVFRVEPNDSIDIGLGCDESGHNVDSCFMLVVNIC